MKGEPCLSTLIPKECRQAGVSVPQSPRVPQAETVK